MFFECTYYKIASELPARTYGYGGNGIEWHTHWPETTSCYCWHCCHPFDTKPVPLPVKHDSRLDVFQVTGVFCSWACMYAYAKNNYLQSMVIMLFRKRCTGKIGGLIPAPPRMTLKIFGGHLGIDEFRKTSEDGIAYTLLPPKMILQSHILHEHMIQDKHASLRARVNEDDVHVDLTTEHVSTTSNSLKLRRPKTIKKPTLFDKIISATQHM